MMNKKIKTLIILGAILAGGIIAAVLGYNALSSRIAPDNMAEAAVGETVAVPGAENETKTAGKTAGDFTMLDNDGKEVRLSDHFGKPVVLNFWATWCPPCRQEMPHFDKVYQERGDVVDFMMVNLTDGVRDDVLTVQDFINTNGYKFPVYFDSAGSGASEYGVMYIPTTVFIRADGSVMQTHPGAMSEDKLNSYIDELLKP